MTDAERLTAALRPWEAVWSAPAWVGHEVVVGCSGGPDSLALLALAVARGLDVVAVHVDHGLRPGSESEAGVVASVARRLGARFRAVQVTVAPGGDLESRARSARLGALAAEQQRLGASAVLLGHTADDQAETVLLHVLRGAGLAGVAGIPAARPPFARPLLALARSDTVEVCARLGLTPVDDPMNGDLAFRRVWLRREAIPFLEAALDADLRARLARQAEVVRADLELLDELADRELDALGAVPGGPTLRADVAALPPALARRSVRRWLAADGPPPSLAAVDAVLAVARGETTAAEIEGGMRIERAAGSLHRLAGTDERRELPEFPVPVPGQRSGGGWAVETRIERAAPVAWPDGVSTCVLDADAAGPRLSIAPASPGERFAPLGLSGTKTVSEALAEAGVPAGRRAHHPVVRDRSGTPLWVVGYRVAAQARVTAATRRYLWVTAERRPQNC